MPVTVEDVERVLTQLRRPDKTLREALMKELQAWEQEPLPPAVAHALLRGAAEDYPEVEGWPRTPNEHLVSMLTNGAQVDPAVALEVYPRLEDECRAWVLRLLATLSSRDASAALARLLAEAGEGAGLPDVRWPVLLPLERAPRHPELLAGPLIQCLEANIWPRSVGGALLGNAQARLLDVAQRQATTAAAVPRVADLLATLDSLDPDDKGEEAYQSARSEAGLLLDLIGEVNVEEGRAALAAAAQHQDTWVAMWGVLGLLEAGSDAPQSAIARVAGDIATRSALFEKLEAMGQLERYPARYRNQAALAESVMVRWLTYPTELASAPDEIEELEVIALNTDDGMVDLYVYRFRTFEPHWAAKDGWMVGVAGPFLRSEQPTTRSLGWTFSRFEKFDLKPIDEHVEAIVGTVGDWRRARGQTPRLDP